MQRRKKYASIFLFTVFGNHGQKNIKLSSAVYGIFVGWQALLSMFLSTFQEIIQKTFASLIPGLREQFEL